MLFIKKVAFDKVSVDQGISYADLAFVKRKKVRILRLPTKILLVLTRLLEASHTI